MGATGIAKRLLRQKRVVFVVGAFFLLVGYGFYAGRHPLHLRRHEKNSSYVTLCQARLKGYHRTGNHLFMLSAVLDLATRTDREVIMPTNGWFLDKVFDFDRAGRSNFANDFRVHRYDSKNQICPCETIQTPHFGYDARFNQTNFIDKYSFENGSVSRATLELCGLSQTFLHALNPDVRVKMRTLPRLLKDNAFEESKEIIGLFKKAMNAGGLTSFVLYSYGGVKDNKTSFVPLKSLFETLISSTTTGIKDDPFVVGVHVRMGDFLQKSHVDYGLTVADGRYFRKAFEFFIQLHKRVLFVVLSDDIEWATGHFREYFYPTNSSSSGTTPSHAMYNTNDVKIVFFRDTLPQDFALLCRTNGLIISTGTFGWWAGWFNSDAKVVYYENYPRPKTTLGAKMNKKHYYLSNWIPLD